MGDDLKASSFKVTKMGNNELTKLWNLCPDNMVACTSQKRNYLPGLEEFFETAIEQSDPSAGIEEEYKVIKNLTFGWKGLRLLARKSSHFFSQPPAGTGNVYKRVPDYLELMVGKMAKDLPTTPAHDAKAEVDETTVTNGNGEIDNVKDEDTADEENEEDNDNDDVDADDGTSANNDDEDDEPVNRQHETQSEAIVTEDLLQTVASKLEPECWKSLASKLKFQDDDICYFESENASVIDRTLKMLTVWKDNERTNATISVLKTTLLEIDQLKHVADILN